MAWAQKWNFAIEKIPYRLNLECIGDWQLGSRSCCTWKIKQHTEDILESAKNVDTAVIIAGDIEDEDRPSGREIRKKIAAERSEMVERDAEKHISWIETDVIPYLKPLHEGTKYGIIGGVAGHHWTFLPGGYKVGDKVVYNSVDYIFSRLEQMTGKPCIYLGQMVSFLEFSFKWKSKVKKIVGVLQHGEGGGQTKGSTLTKLERTVSGFDGDFYIRGHDCQLVATKNDQLFAKDSRDNKPNIGSKTKAILNLGSATMGYETGRGQPSYIENSMLRPSTMGWGTIKFNVRRSHTWEDPHENLAIDMKIEI